MVPVPSHLILLGLVLSPIVVPMPSPEVVIRIDPPLTSKVEVAINEETVVVAWTYNPPFSGFV